MDTIHDHSGNPIPHARGNLVGVNFIKHNQPTWPNTLKHLIDFTKGKIRFEKNDIKFCENFSEYICMKVSANTANSYYARFKSSLETAVRELLLSKIQQLKDAFLFSCFTGLKLSDIEALTTKQIQDGDLHFRQRKTGDMERIKLNPGSLKIIEDQIKTNHTSKSNIFLLPSRTHIKRPLRLWIKEAGIDKKNTFHSARHTFATLCLTYDVDLYTVSKLLGHKDIQTTQIYAKLIDKKKDDAIDKLPSLDS